MEERREQTVTTTTTTTPTPVVPPARPVVVAPAVVTTDRVDTVTADSYELQRITLFRIKQFIYFILGVIEGLLLIRFVLRLLGANPAAGFAQFIYGITAPLLAPFFGLFGAPRFEGSVLEISTLVAMIVYALLAWVIWKVILLLAGPPRSTVTTQRVETHMR
jgi:uncharacterized protein YggT (Ycf19 family)